MSNNYLWCLLVDEEFRGLYDQATAARLSDELSQQLLDAKISMSRADSWPIQTPQFIKEGE